MAADAVQRGEEEMRRSRNSPEDTRGDGSSRSAAGTKRGSCNSRVPARFPDAVAAACGRWCSSWFWGTSFPRQVEGETHTHRAAGRPFCTSPKASSCSAQACRIRSRGGHLIIGPSTPARVGAAPGTPAMAMGVSAPSTPSRVGRALRAASPTLASAPKISISNHTPNSGEGQPFVERYNDIWAGAKLGNEIAGAERRILHLESLGHTIDAEDLKQKCIVA